MKIPIFPGKYHQNGGFSMAMLVYRRVLSIVVWKWWSHPNKIIEAYAALEKRWVTRYQSKLRSCGYQMNIWLKIGWIWHYMDVSKNRGGPVGPQNGWFIMENPIFKWTIWGFSHIFGNHFSKWKTTGAMTSTYHLSETSGSINIQSITIILCNSASGYLCFGIVWVEKHPQYQIILQGSHGKGSTSKPTPLRE